MKKVNKAELKECLTNALRRVIMESKVNKKPQVKG